MQEESELQLIINMLPFLIPLFIIQVALLVIALVDLIRRKQVRGGNKVLWALLIVFVEIIGPSIYLLFGRKEDTVDSD